MFPKINTIFSYVPKLSTIEGYLPVKALSSYQKISRLRAILLFSPVLVLGLCIYFYKRRVSILSQKEGGASTAPSSSGSLIYRRLNPSPSPQSPRRDSASAPPSPSSSSSLPLPSSENLIRIKRTPSEVELDDYCIDLLFPEEPIGGQDVINASEEELTLESPDTSIATSPSNGSPIVSEDDLGEPSSEDISSPELRVGAAKTLTVAPPIFNLNAYVKPDYIDDSFPIEPKSVAALADLVSSIFLELKQEEEEGWFASIDYFGIGNMWTKTWDYAYWLGSQIHRGPNPIHDPKYQLALAAQRRALRTCDRIKNLRESELNELEQKFVADAIQAIETLQKPETEFSSIREHNRAFLTFLRDALQSPCYKDPRFKHLAQILQEICWGKFTSNVMTSYEKQILEHAIGSSNAPFTSKEIAMKIREDNEKLKNCDSNLRKATGDLIYQKLTNELDVYSDPLGTSNIPEIRSIHTVKDPISKYDVIYMRHGTPTFAPDLSSLIARVTGNIYVLVGMQKVDPMVWNQAKIIPEYHAFLDAAQRKNSSVLYVNHQDMSLENTAEYNRSVVIEALQDEHEIFHFLALPFDGPIWKKIGAGTFAEWKTRVLNAVIHQTDGFRLPKGFKAGAEFGEILEKIQDLYFPHQKELSLEERTVFLSIFYSYIKEVVKAKYGIQILVSACKDNKDRGNASSGIDEALFNLRLGRENDPKALEDLYLRTLSPFIVKYEEILEHRLAPLLLLLQHIAKLSADEKEKIRGYFPIDGYIIQDQRVPYEDSRYSQLAEFISV